MRDSPCPNCTIIRAPQTREECKTEVYQKLAEYTGSEVVAALSEETTFEQLGLDQTSARGFWATFWVACDIPPSLQPGGVLENLLPDDNFPPMPRTLREFVDQVARDRTGTSYLACDECWVPG